MSADLREPSQTGDSAHGENARIANASPNREHTLAANQSPTESTLTLQNGVTITVHEASDVIWLSRDDWSLLVKAYADLQTKIKELTAESLELQKSLDQSRSEIRAMSIHDSLLTSAIDQLWTAMGALLHPRGDSEQINPNQDVMMDISYDSRDDSSDQSSEEE